MITIKQLQESVPDLIGKVYTENKYVTVIDIIHGRIKVMPEHRKPRRKKKNLHS